MASFTIKDGTGSGGQVKVKSNGLKVYGSVGSTFHHESEEGNAWSLATPSLPVTATGGRGLWIECHGGTLDVENILLSWNGGNTNHNRSLEVQIYEGDTEPDTNMTELSAMSTSLGGAATAEVHAQHWDGVGDGITGHTAGNLLYTLYVPQGTYALPIPNLFYVKFKATLSFNLKGEEAGKASVAMVGYSEELGGH